MSGSLRTWNPDEVDAVRDLLAAGLSRSQIARRLGCKSRAAVCGLVRRLRAEMPAPPIKNRLVVTRLRAKPASRKRSPRRDPAGRVAPRRKPVPLVELGPLGCHWPVQGEGAGTFFCNTSRAGSSHKAYCAYHACIARQPGRA
jgi:hypothetical protein